VTAEPNGTEHIRAVLEERARRLAAPLVAAGGSSRTLELVRFTVGNERYALPAACVRRIASIPALTPLPGLPAYFLGLINVRGMVLPLVDIAQLLGALPAEVRATTRVIVCGDDRAEFGLAADSVIAVEPFAAEAFERAQAAGELVRGVTADALVLIDGDALFRDARLYPGRSAEQEHVA
jgi:purine-binding chemotaxis protein CheW